MTAAANRVVIAALVALALPPALPPAAHAQSSTVSIVLKAAGARGATRGGGTGRRRGGARHKSPDTPAPAERAGAGAGANPAFAAAPANHGERLDNATVLSLTRIGLGDPAIIAKIHASAPAFDVATDTLIALRREGVSSAVLAAMIDQQNTVSLSELRPDSPDPRDPHPAGFYLLAGWLPAPRMLAMRPTTTARTTSGSVLGYAFSGGLVPVSYRAIVPSSHAAIVAGDPRPAFYVFTGAATPSQSLISNWGAPPSPDAISLVRFAETRNGREVKIGRFTLHGATTGIDPRDAIGFSAAEVAAGVMVLRPDRDLPPGEYGFIQTAAGVGVSAAAASTSTARIFDFAVGANGEGSREGALGDPAGIATRDNNSSNAAIIAAEELVLAAERGARTARAKHVRAVKQPNSSPSLYPGGK